jgi:predicted DNA-binding protein
MPRIMFKSIYDEPKTNQMSIRLGDRLKQDLEKIATMNRATVTDIVTEALTAYVKNHSQDVQYYNKVFGNEVGDE